MADALTAPLLVAAVVLAVAGIAKLRFPAGAERALRTLGLLVSGIAIRGFAVGEIALAAWVLLDPGPIANVALAGVYAIFALMTILLARRQASCGCFGESSTPASASQSAISAALSVVALLAAVAGAHGIDWMLHRSVPSGIVLIVGVAGAAYGTVVAYSQIPSAWTAWSGS
jgi:hypothetical protein